VDVKDLLTYGRVRRRQQGSGAVTMADRLLGVKVKKKGKSVKKSERQMKAVAEVSDGREIKAGKRSRDGLYVRKDGNENGSDEKRTQSREVEMVDEGAVQRDTG
jgi:hypothetical protein